LGDFDLGFLVEGSARVGGGVPIFARAAAFTADAVLNGLGLRGFDGIALLCFLLSDLSSSSSPS
jgi:hypothetical protein